MRNTVAAKLAGLIALAIGLGAGGALGQSFSDLVGDVRVGSVKSTGALEVPYITWGGDVATFVGNGGLETKSGSLFQQQGLNLKLRAGDDFVGQVRRYMAGDSPFLRGTLRMLGQASEVLGRDSRTKAVVFLQLTWSAGDHMVARADVKTLDDLRGKKIALQQGGPHVGMLDDILRSVQLGWDDVEIVWTEELTGDKGAANLFRNDSSIDAALVITPDMFGLTGGLEDKGSGAEGTVRDSHVLISTATMSRSIADVYACRKDYFDANKETIEKFVAGYIKAAETVVEQKEQFVASGRSAPYMGTLRLTQQIFGEDVIPTLEVDAHGLIADCTFMGLPGNVSFFTDAGNPSGFEAKQKAALDLAVDRKYASVRSGFFPPYFDYDSIARRGGLKFTSVRKVERVGAESIDLFPDSELDERTIFSFTINFEPNQNSFSADVYGAEFQRTVEAASTFGNAIVAIRGHSDPTKALVDLIKAGMETSLIKRSGSSGNYKYFFRNRPLDLSQTAEVVKLIEGGSFDRASVSPRETVQAALNLSRRRSEQVRDAIVAYAKDRGLTLDASQIQPVGVGVAEPLIAKPRNMNEARTNMRVEFRLLRVPAEVLASSDFDF